MQRIGVLVSALFVIPTAMSACQSDSTNPGATAPAADSTITNPTGDDTAGGDSTAPDDSQVLPDDDVDVAAETGPEGPKTVEEWCAQVGEVGCCDPLEGALYCDGEIFTGDCGGDCGWLADGYYECGGSGADPSGQHPYDCPPIPGGCEPSCPAGGCGMDDGCGTPCGCSGAEVCSGGTCVAGPTGDCDSGDKQCSQSTAEVCVSGHWQTDTVCAHGCLNGICLNEGTTCDCEIDASLLKVTFPYASTNPPTVVSIAGSCYMGLDSNPCGHRSASALKVLKDETASVVIKDVYGGGFVWGIIFSVSQADPTSSQYGTLSTATGIPKDFLTASSAATVTTGISQKPVLVGYTLPEGVTLNVFIPTSTSEKGTFTFQSSDKTKLDPVLTQLNAAAGIVVDQGFIEQMGLGKTFTYRFKLTKNGLAIVSITPD